MSTDDAPATTEPLTITAHRKNSEWWIRIEDDRGGIPDDRRSSWDGHGDFYQEGLNRIIDHIPDGYAYRGSEAWESLSDGSYTASLYRFDPRFFRS